MDNMQLGEIIIWVNLLLTLLISLGGAFIGGYISFKLKSNKENKRKESIRSIAKNAINVLAGYKGKSYQEAENEFNNKINVTNKRIILVLLAKLGIPITFDKKTNFDIKNIKFLNRIIDENELADISSQIDSGNCDDLFFLDPETYFNNNFVIKYKREIAKKYVDEVFSKSLVWDDGKIHYPNKWEDKFTQREVDILQIFSEKLCFQRYYDESTKNPKIEFVKELHKELDIGLWDDYLNWSYDIYSNVQMNSLLAKMNIELLQNKNTLGDKESGKSTE